MNIRIKGAIIFIIVNTSLQPFKVEKEDNINFCSDIFSFWRRNHSWRKMKLTLILLLIIGVYSAQGKNFQLHYIDCGLYFSNKHVMHNETWYMNFPLFWLKQHIANAGYVMAKIIFVMAKMIWVQWENVPRDGIIVYRPLPTVSINEPTA